MTGENASNAECANGPIIDYGRRLRTLAVSFCGVVHLVSNGLARTPDFLPGGRIQTKQNLLFALPSKDVDLVVCNYRCRMADTNGNSPFFLQLLGPDPWNRGVAD